MAAAPTNPSKPVNVNERTYQEVEYLKKNLGPILVAALAEICIRRPADPIEYLGHWLLRWRYNEELKRRDVQNALDVVRQKQWAQAQEEGKPELFSQGVTPGHPYGPPGYGGPLNPEDIGEAAEQEVPETTFNGNEEAGEGEEYEGEAAPSGFLQGPELEEGQERRASQAEDRKLSMGPDGQPRKLSGAPEAGLADGQRKASQGPVGLEGERKVSVGPAGVPGAEGERKPSLPPGGEVRKTSVGPAAAHPAPAEVHKTSVGPATAGAEVRKASTGSAAGAPPPPAAEVRKTSVGPAPGAEVRKTSVGPAGAVPPGDARKPSTGSVRKSSGLPGDEGRKASVGPAAAATGEVRKTSVGPAAAATGEVRKTSVGPAGTERKPSTGSAAK